MRSRNMIPETPGCTRLRHKRCHTLPRAVTEGNKHDNFHRDKTQRNATETTILVPETCDRFENRGCTDGDSKHTIPKSSHSRWWCFTCLTWEIGVYKYLQHDVDAPANAAHLRNVELGMLLASACIQRHASHYEVWVLFLSEISCSPLSYWNERWSIVVQTWIVFNSQWARDNGLWAWWFSNWFTSFLLELIETLDQMTTNLTTIPWGQHVRRMVLIMQNCCWKSLN